MASGNRSDKRWLRAYGDDLAERIQQKKDNIKAKEDEIVALRVDLRKDQDEFDEVFRPHVAAARQQDTTDRNASASSSGAAAPVNKRIGVADSTGATLALKRAKLGTQRSAGTQTEMHMGHFESSDDE